MRSCCQAVVSASATPLRSPRTTGRLKPTLFLCGVVLIATTLRHISTEDFITHAHKFISIHSAVLYVDETQSGDQGRDLLRVPLRHSLDVCGRASWLADWVVGPSFKKRDPVVTIQLSGYHSPQSPWDALHPEDQCCCHSGSRTVDRLLLYQGYWRLDGSSLNDFCWLQEGWTTMCLYCLGIYSMHRYGPWKGSHSPINTPRMHIPTSVDL